MPPKAIKTIKDLIYWEYAKLISGSAGLGRKQYPFVMRKVAELKKGIIKWSDILREDLKMIYICHECRGTLDKGDINKDGILNVLDLGAIFKEECIKK